MVLRSIIVVITPPRVSMPKVRGVVQSKMSKHLRRRDDTRLECMPIATASSKLMPL